MRREIILPPLHDTATAGEFAQRSSPQCAAVALLQALIARATVPRDRILLTDIEYVDWQLLTFTGERLPLQLGRMPAQSPSICVQASKTRNSAFQA
jgi:hypothetical protein